MTNRVQYKKKLSAELIAELDALYLLGEEEFKRRNLPGDYDGFSRVKNGSMYLRYFNNDGPQETIWI